MQTSQIVAGSPEDGQTLQELIAPKVVYFFARDWAFIGQKCPLWWNVQPFEGPIPNSTANATSFMSKLANIAGIPHDVLCEVDKVRSKSAAQRRSWASRRETTRSEDSAYSLMGLFDVNMPILYGEGETKAFHRLQLEIIREVPDQSIFAWRREPGYGGLYSDSGLLAKSPRDFHESSEILISQPALSTIRPHAMTNVGLFINVRIWQGKDNVGDDRVLASLRCWTQRDGDTLDRVRIYLRQIRNVTAVGSDCLMYRRDYCDTLDLATFPSDLGTPQDIYVLEDAQFDHVRLINNLDVFEPEDKGSPGHPPTRKSHYQEL
ncbi:uncharacterized protein PAC_10485 [Phialocephala subalpina]|uniref:DUF8212 domain-containing protein n=1 Tax=Phialocephala subalpina TaxID=576137 RepID=A0A1L7X6E1_9HELO|nr:uncharacterized protein PAC_10485 [Phialocephala subalpina]